MTHYTLAYPGMLLFLILLLLFLIRHCLKKNPAVRVGSLTPFLEAERKGSPFRKLYKKGLPVLFYALGGIALVFAMSSPREGMEQIRRRADGIDIMIALDLSGSMQAIDVPGNIRTENELTHALSSGKVMNRLNSAKKEVAKFIEERPNDRIGLVAFAPLPYLVCPPTLDHSFLLANLNRLESGIIGDQTAIAPPIATAVRRLKDSDSKRRVIVLFTDGVNNVNSKITPLQAAKLAETFNITIYTVGIGSNNAVMLQDGFFGSGFARVRGEFDEKLLQEIAKTTSGVYYRAEDGDSMRKAMKQIDQLEKTSVEQKITVNWKEFYPVLALLSAALLMTGLFLEKTFCLTLP